MTAHNQSPCPDDKILLAYYAGDLDASAALALEVHVAGCARCVARARDLRLRMARAAAAIEPALAVGADHVCAEAAAEAVLADMEAGEPAAIRGPARNWAAGAVRCFLDRPAKAARMSLDGLADILAPNPAWPLIQLEAIPAAVSRGAAPAGGSVAQASTPSQPTARILLRGTDGKLSVLLQETPAVPQPPRVRLVYTNGETREAVTRPGQGDAAGAYVAEFADLPSGEFVVAIVAASAG